MVLVFIFRFLVCSAMADKLRFHREASAARLPRFYPGLNWDGWPAPLPSSSLGQCSNLQSAVVGLFWLWLMIV